MCPAKEHTGGRVATIPSGPGHPALPCPEEASAAHTQPAHTAQLRGLQARAAAGCRPTGPAQGWELRGSSSTCTVARNRFVTDFPGAASSPGGCWRCHGDSLWVSASPPPPGCAGAQAQGPSRLPCTGAGWTPWAGDGPCWPVWVPVPKRTPGRGRLAHVTQTEPRSLCCLPGLCRGPGQHWHRGQCRGPGVMLGSQPGARTVTPSTQKCHSPCPAGSSSLAPPPGQGKAEPWSPQGSGPETQLKRVK